MLFESWFYIRMKWSRLKYGDSNAYLLQISITFDNFVTTNFNWKFNFYYELSKITSFIMVSRILIGNISQISNFFLTQLLHKKLNIWVHVIEMYWTLSLSKYYDVSLSINSNSLWKIIKIWFSEMWTEYVILCSICAFIRFTAAILQWFSNFQFVQINWKLNSESQLIYILQFYFQKKTFKDNQVWKLIFYFELAVPHQKSIVACISIRFCTTSSKNIPKIISFSKLLTYSQFKNYTITYSKKLPNIEYWNLKRGWLQFVWKICIRIGFLV